MNRLTHYRLARLAHPPGRAQRGLVHLLWADPTQVGVEVTDGIVDLAGTVDPRSTAAPPERPSASCTGSTGVVDVVSRPEFQHDDRGLAPQR